MNLLTSLSLLTSLLPPSTASRQNLTHPFQPPPTSPLTKRWYSIPTPIANQIPGGWGPWPRICPGHTEPQPLRYCFADARSHTNLQPLLDEAIARWAPALLASRLTIAPDHPAAAVCDWSLHRPDTLVVTDATRDGDDAWNWERCQTETTTGYRYGSAEAGRHALVFCEAKPGEEGAWTRPFAVRSLMHELGHAVGLTHEHQRVDRGEWLWFYCRRLAAYKQLKEDGTLMIDAKAMFEEEATEKERFELVCQIQEYAQAYLPDALPYIKGNNMADPRFETYEASSQFDFDSIMIYNSYPGGGKVGTSKDWVLTRKSDGSPVWMGGEQDPSKAAISEGDVARVKQLYGGVAGQEDSGGWAVSGISVKVRGEWEMVVPPARRRGG